MVLCACQPVRLYTALAQVLRWLKEQVAIASQLHLEGALPHMSTQNIKIA